MRGLAPLLDRHRFAALFVLGLLLSLPFQGSRGLYDSTEGRYAEVAREMADGGSLIHPTLSGAPHYTKPPPTYWLIGAGLRAFGTGTWGARFGNAVIFALTAAVLSEIAAALWGAGAALAAGLVYLSSPLPFAAASVLSADTLLALWSTCAVLAFVKGVENPGSARAWIRWMWLALGLGFATKGPPALLPLAPILLYRLRGDRSVRLADPWGILAFLVAGFWWYGLVALQVPGTAGTFVGRELIARNLTAGAHRNSEWYAPLLIYVPTLFLGGGAWLIYALRGVSRKSAAEAARRALARPLDLPTAVTTCWLVVPFLVFCLSKSRLALYMLAVYPPFALWLARRALARSPDLRQLSRIVAVSCLVMIAIKAASAGIPHRADSGRLFRAAEQAGGRDTHLLLVDDPKRYGLEFYTRGSLERLSFQPEPWSNRTLDAAAADIARSGGRESWTFVVKPSNTAAVASSLERAGLEPRVTQVTGWDLLVCRPVP
jgi:4-amino-4-deoxy-L-arabinose transferase